MFVYYGIEGMLCQIHFNIYFGLFQSYIERGLFGFTYGEETSLVEFLHIDNLVQAHVLAGAALSEQRKHIAVCII